MGEEMYVIRTKNGLLNGFYGNDLPTTKKLYLNERKGELEPKFTLRNMMNCSGGYMVFKTKKEAEEQIAFIRNWVEGERERYESALKGSADKLLSVIDNFKVEKVNLNC